MISRRNVLLFSAGVEGVTGIGLIAAPARVLRVLLASDLTGTGPIVARFFGVGLLALALAVWPRTVEVTAQPVRAMLVYNMLLAVYLVWIGVAEHLVGPLLWPAVVGHAAVATMLAWPGRKPV